MIVDKDIMTEKTRQFYKTLQIDIPDEYIELAVMSLTMPQYAKEFKDKYHEKIGDHRALATVGDAVCGAFLMLDRYEKSKTKKALTAEKKAVTNESLNLIGKKMLEGLLFANNNDLISKNGDENKKAYATAFEAVVGFVALLDKYHHTNKANDIFLRLLSEC